jgi:hypothetical protein
MKTTLIRMMTFILFATSISAFAQSVDTKREDAATACNTAQQKYSNQKQETNQKGNKTIRPDGKDWDHSLLGIYG